jgi:TonB family protein
MQPLTTNTRVSRWINHDIMKCKSFTLLVFIAVLAGNAIGQDTSEFRLCPCHDGLQEPLFKGCEFMDDCIEAQKCAFDELLKTAYSVTKYPVEARRHSIQGKVVVEFDIDIYGVASNFRVQNDTLGYGIPEAAIEGARIACKRGFFPAEQDCRVKQYTYSLPIEFKLR